MPGTVPQIQPRACPSRQRDIVRDQTIEFDQWNFLAAQLREGSKAERAAYRDLQNGYWQWLRRFGPTRFSANEFRVLSFIGERTFGWGKLLEAIPNDQFMDGIRDALDGTLVQGGCGISKKSTVIGVVRSLEQGGYTERFLVKAYGRQAKYAYTCFPRPLLVYHFTGREITRDVFNDLGDMMTVQEVVHIIADRVNDGSIAPELFRLIEYMG